ESFREEEHDHARDDGAQLQPEEPVHRRSAHGDVATRGQQDQHGGSGDEPLVHVPSRRLLAGPGSARSWWTTTTSSSSSKPITNVLGLTERATVAAARRAPSRGPSPPCRKGMAR